MIGSFGESIHTGKTNIYEVMKDQSNLLVNMVKFDNKSRSRLKEHKKKKEVLMKVHMLFTKVEN